MWSKIGKIRMCIKIYIIKYLKSLKLENKNQCKKHSKNKEIILIIGLEQ